MLKSIKFTAVFLLLFSCAPGAVCAHAAEYLVTKVIDGDTIELSNGRRVRYIGIDTPEIRRRVGRDWKYDPEPYSLKAKDHNRALVGGERVKLEFDVQKEDKYGRWLAYVYAGDRMANEELLREGYATLHIYPPNTRHLGLLIDAQEEARVRGAGMWEAVKAVSAVDAFRNIGRLCAIRGKVLRVGASRGAVYLNFGERGENGFTAVIYRRNLPFFEEEGISPSRDYEGKYIEVTGRIKDRGGPQIIVYHPLQIMEM